MTISELDEAGQQFLIQLFEQTSGDPSAQVSMYDVGEGLGLEIRTLSGGIGISTEGANEVKRLTGGVSAADGSPGKLTDQPIMDTNSCRGVEQAAGDLKSKAGNLGLDFDGLSELMADLKTIDAQLGSSRPKTAIIRECLCSLKTVLEDLADNESLVQIRALLGE
jgi:hypothetical protein